MHASVMSANLDDGGLKMINVKAVLNALQVKWMHCLTLDMGLIWSQYIWGDIEK